MTSAPVRAQRPGLRLGSIGGVPLYLANSWAFGLLVLAIVFGSQLARAAVDPVGVVGMAAGLVVILAISVLVHEAAHALVGLALGYTVTSIVLSMLGGHTTTLTYKAVWWRDLALALAGPAANLALAGLAWLPAQAAADGLPGFLAYAAMMINAGLGIFNALPGLPLDGGQALAALVWGITGRRSTGVLVGAYGGIVVAVGVVAWFIVLPAVTQPGSADLVSNAWTLLIAAFLLMGALQMIKVAKARRAIDALTVADVSEFAPLVGADATVQQAAQATGGEPRPVLLVGPAGLAGAVLRFPASPDFAWQRVAQFAVACRREPIDFEPTDPVSDLAAMMDHDGSDVVPVRYPTGEPRVITRTALADGLRRTLIAAP